MTLVGRRAVIVPFDKLGVDRKSCQEGLIVLRPLHMQSWANVSADCAINAIVDELGMVTLVFGRQPDEFEFSFDRAALRRMLEVGTTALAEAELR